MDNTIIEYLNLCKSFNTLSHNSNSQIVFLIAFLIFWSVLYAIVNYKFSFKSLKQKDQNDTKNRIVSIVHGTLSFWFATSQYLPPTYNQPNTNFQTFVILFSLSYCIYDLIACIYYRLSDFSLISHHLFCILGFGFGVITGYGAIDGIGGLFVAEVSNFCMHSRVILRTFNKKHTKAYEYFQNFYLITYIIFRGILCPFILWYPCVTSSNSPIVVKMMCTSLTLQSFYFIFQMIQIIKKKLKKYKQMKQKNINYQWLQQMPAQLQKLSFYKKSESSNIF